MTETISKSSDWRDGFLFVGNQLLLDFLNTRPVQDGEAMELLNDLSDILRWFVAAKQLTPREASEVLRKWNGSREAAELPHRLRQWRDRLRKAVISWEATGRIATTVLEDLNRKLAEHPMHTRLQVEDGELSSVALPPTRNPEDLFGPLAQGAAELFASADRTRVRQCGSCVLLFLDTSKKGTRHWCSMQLCGNRAKVAAYSARRRKEED